MHGLAPAHARTPILQRLILFIAFQSFYEILSSITLVAEGHAARVISAADSLFVGESELIIASQKNPASLG